MQVQCRGGILFEEMIRGGPIRLLMMIVLAVRLSGAFLCEFDDGHEHPPASHGGDMISSDHGDLGHNRIANSFLDLHTMLSSQAPCDNHDDTRFVANISPRSVTQLVRASIPLGMLPGESVGVVHNAAVAISGPSEHLVLPSLTPASLILRI